MRQSRIVGVDHVHLDAGVGTLEILRWFYGELVGLEEVETRIEESQLRFRSEHLEIRIRLSSNPEIDSVRSRVTILVPSLIETAAQLDERSLEYQRISGINFTDRRLSMLDPAGNRVELRQSWSWCFL